MHDRVEDALHHRSHKGRGVTAHYLEAFDIYFRRLLRVEFIHFRRVPLFRHQEDGTVHLFILQDVRSFIN